MRVPVPMTDFAWYMTVLVIITLTGILGYIVGTTRSWPQPVIDGAVVAAAVGTMCLIGASLAWLWLEVNT